MEANNIDSKIKNIISENPDFYNAKADAAKENIWANINTKKTKKTNLFLIYSLSAACIALLILSGVLGGALLKTKSHTPNTFLSIETVKDQGEYFLRKRPIYRIKKDITIDTIFITRTEIRNQPIEITNTIIDTVFINQIEYIEIDAPQDNYIVEDNFQFPENENSTPHSKEVLISNSSYETKNKKPKVKFKFGGNNNQNGNGSLALTTNL